MNLPKNVSKEDLKKIFDMYAKRSGYTETPATIMEFISDPYYLGNSTNGGKYIYSFWKKKLVELFPTPFFESNKQKVIILSGATGIGKSFFANLVFLYDLHRILCLENPQEKFGFPTSTKFFFTLTNSTKENIEEVNYAPIINMIKESPFFRSKYNMSKNKNSLFINNIDINMVSRQYSLVGKNVMCAISDEINQEVIKGGSKNIVVEMYNRINSRFLLEGNKWPGHYCVISSAMSENSLIQTLIDNIKENGKDENISNEYMVISAPRFEILKEKTKYSGKKFKIFIGNYQSDPFFINNEEELQRAKEIDPNRIYEVPIEHRNEFETDIYAGIRDVLGIPVSDVRTFIPFKEKIKSSLSLSKLVPDEIILKPDERLIDKFNSKPNIFKEEAERVIGLDIGLKRDRLGLSMIHLHDLRDTKNGQEGIYWVDFAIGVKAPKGMELKLSQIRQFIYDLSEMGVNIKLIVTDGYQSTDTIQILSEKGYNAKLSSVDRKKDPYYSLRNALLEDRIFMPRNEILFKELVFLQENEKKIDHPETNPDGSLGSKDISDAVCNAFYNALEVLQYNPITDKSFIDELNNLDFDDPEEKLLKRLFS